MHVKFQSENLKGRDYLGELRIKKKNQIEIIFLKKTSPAIYEIYIYISQRFKIL
jgi:hypothetical protein